VVAWRVLACERSFEVALKDEIAGDSRREGETMVKRDKTRGVTRDTSTRTNTIGIRTKKSWVIAPRARASLKKIQLSNINC
jgi:hypothetical protein